MPAVLTPYQAWLKALEEKRREDRKWAQAFRATEAVVALSKGKIPKCGCGGKRR